MYMYLPTHFNSQTLITHHWSLSFSKAWHPSTTAWRARRPTWSRCSGCCTRTTLTSTSGRCARATLRCTSQWNASTERMQWRCASSCSASASTPTTGTTCVCVAGEVEIYLFLVFTSSWSFRITETCTIWRWRRGIWSWQSCLLASGNQTKLRKSWKKRGSLITAWDCSFSITCVRCNDNSECLCFVFLRTSWFASSWAKVMFLT